MKNIISITRKLILLPLLGFIFIIINIILSDLPTTIAAVPLSFLNNKNFNMNDKSFKNNFQKYVHQRSKRFNQYSNDKYDTDYNYNTDPDYENNPSDNGNFVLHSEGGPIITKFNAIKKNVNNFNENDLFQDRNYVATTPENIDTFASLDESDRYDNIYEDKSDNYNQHEKSVQTNPMEILNTAKTMWDIFTALNTAWNTIGHERILKEKSEEDERSKRNSYYRQIDRIFNNNNNNTQYTEIEQITPNTMNGLSNTEILTATEQTDIAEGRYIKGDPLKGYYDFVITEGSYKFWAAFQLLTAALIIYSTFAAIYYSKVNPLVGDYDYVDYLGGGRSLSSNDADFIDDDNAPMPYSRPSSTTTEKNTDDSSRSVTKSNWSSMIHHTDWLPKIGHTIQFILESIDKIPQ